MSLIEQTQTLARIVAKCRVDADYKSSLISDPVTVLRDGGVDIPDGLSIEFVPSGQDVPASTQEVAYVSIDVLDRDSGLLTGTGNSAQQSESTRHVATRRAIAWLCSIKFMAATGVW